MKVMALKRGSFWRETLDLRNTAVTVAAYGEGPAPLIDASDPVLPSEWMPTPGTPGLYQVTRIAVTDTNSQHVSLWVEDGLAGKRADSLDSCASTPGTFWVTGEFKTGVGYLIYLHPSDGSDPRTNGVQYYAPARMYGAFLAGGGRVEGIRTRRQLGHDGSIVVVNGPADIRNCVAEEGYIHDIYWQEGVVRNCHTRNAELGYSYVANPQVAGGTVELYDSVAEQLAPGGATGPGFFLHGNASTRCEVQRFECRGYECAVGSADPNGTVIFADVSHEAGTKGNRRTFDLGNQYNNTKADIFIIRPRSLAGYGVFLHHLHPQTRVFIWEPVVIADAMAIQGLECTEIHIVGGVLIAKNNPSVNLADAQGRARGFVSHSVISIDAYPYFVMAQGGSFWFENNVYWRQKGDGPLDALKRPTDPQRWSINNTLFFGQTGLTTGGFDDGSVLGDPRWVNDPVLATKLADVNLDVQPDSPCIPLGAGPGRVPASYQFPGWVPQYVRDLCLAPRCG